MLAGRQVQRHSRQLGLVIVKHAAPAQAVVDIDRIDDPDPETRVARSHRPDQVITPPHRAVRAEGPRQVEELPRHRHHRPAFDVARLARLHEQSPPHHRPVSEAAPAPRRLRKRESRNAAATRSGHRGKPFPTQMSSSQNTTKSNGCLGAVDHRRRAPSTSAHSHGCTTAVTALHRVRSAAHPRMQAQLCSTSTCSLAPITETRCSTVFSRSPT